MATRKTNTRRRRPRTVGQRIRKFFGYITLLALLTAVVGLIYLAGIFYGVAKDLPAPEELVNYNPGGITEIYATDKEADGKYVVLGRLFIENREFVAINKIPSVLKEATIAIEDERFFSHPGVDLRGIARALYLNARGGRLLEGQGGSTLTQQLARNVYLTHKKTVNRKAQEIMLAIQIEKNYSKEQILEMYMNEIYYGSGAYGVQAASKVYFGRNVKDLSLSQAALLAGLAQRPEYFSPYENKKAALARRNIVLGKMAGLGFITPEQARVAQGNGVRLVGERPKKQFEFRAPYFVNYVVRQLVEKYGYDTVYRGGLKVHTTLNWKMQQEAERALANGVLNARAQRVTEGALICVEPRTGYIRAMVGGVDFKRNQYNNAVQGRRQPGSAFKPIVYTAAFDTHRFGPESRVNDRPINFNGYRPQNYGGGYHGWVTIRRALTFSYNIPAVYVANEIGPRTVIQYAKRMGITSVMEPNLSLALGAYPVSPLEMAAVYSVFANQGDRALPMAIRIVINHEGEALEENAPQVEKAAIPQSTVNKVSEILRDVVEHGTAAGANGIHDVTEAHGKTGTTNDNKDAWFVGYTPELATAVWVTGAKFVKKGDRQVVARYASMSGVTGGRVCAPIWARFMKAAVPIQRKSGEPRPPAFQKIPPSVNTVAKPPRETPIDTDPEETARPRRAERDAPAVGTEGNLPGALSTASLEAGANTPLSVSDAAVAATDPLSPPVFSASASAPASSAPRMRSEPVGARGLDGGVSAPTPTVSAPPVMAPRPPREVAVTICMDSGRRATRWCPETVGRSFVAARAPRSVCRTHRPRPGDG